MHLLEIMADIGMPLLIHGEVTNHEIDIFDRKKEFLEKKVRLYLQRITRSKNNS